LLIEKHYPAVFLFIDLRLGENMISSIKIKGFRGFAEEQELKLSKPEIGKPGSGLTVIVGPNNGGKSTIIESFNVMAQKSDKDFTEGQRNKRAGDRVEIVLEYHEKNGNIDIYNKESLITVSKSGPKAKYNKESVHSTISVLSSRRFFDPYSKYESRESVELSALSSMLAYRGQSFDAISKGKRTYALRKLNEVAESPKLKEILKKVYGKELNWSVDLYNTGNEYVKIKLDDLYSHDSDGLGEGLVNLLFLVSFLVESESNELIVIDEPELSLHPQLQRNLLEVILDFTENIQVLYATHSPEMVSLKSILNGGTLCRVVNQDNGSKIYNLNIANLDKETKNFLRNSNENISFPHVFGYDARSCFFIDDRVVIVEGQEDVVLLKRALEILKINKKINFFGFGAGGAENIRYILKILSSLGFKEVCCLYDRNKAPEKADTEELFPKEKFPRYDFKILNADDIRDKECEVRDKCKKLKDKNYCKNCESMTHGIFEKGRKEINSEFEEDFKQLLEEIGKNYSY
jgi:predicted ATP-dependent endonuclease of OLD family